MSEFEEGAKATAELAKLGTQSVGTAEKMGEFLSRVLGTAPEDAVGLIGDKLAFFRWERQVRMIDNVNEQLYIRGITRVDPVLPKFATPIMENASLEEDDCLQDLWIELLTNALDPNFNEEIRYTFIEIIKSLNPLDVKILSAFYNGLVADNVGISQIATYRLTKEVLATHLGIPVEECLISIHNLFRVQCLTPGIKKQNASIGGEQIRFSMGTDVVSMTPLGWRFVEACLK